MSSLILSSHVFCPCLLLLQVDHGGLVDNLMALDSENAEVKARVCMQVSDCLTPSVSVQAYDLWDNNQRESTQEYFVQECVGIVQSIKEIYHLVS